MNPAVGPSDPAASTSFPRADEDGFRQILEMLGEGVMIYSNGKALYFNPVGRQIAALPDSPAYRDIPVTDLVRQEQQAEISEVLRQMESTHSASGAREQRFLRHDGADLYLEVFSVPVVFENSLARMAVFRDITPRKHAENALRENENYLRLLLSHFPGLVWSIDRNLTVTSCMGVCHSRHGLRAGQLVGRDLSELYPGHENGDSKEVQSHRRALAGETVEYRTHRDGLTFETRLEPLRQGRNAVEGVFAVSRDITDKARDEEALKINEARLRTIADLSPVGLFRVDKRGLCTFVNNQWVQLTGMPPDDAHGRGWMLAIHPDDREPTMAAWNAAVLSGGLFQHEFRIHRPNGQTDWVLGQGLPECHEGEKAENYLGAITKITERKEAELLLAVQKSHLALIAEATPIQEILISLRQFLEKQIPMGHVLFMTVDEERRRLLPTDASTLLIPLMDTLVATAFENPAHPFHQALQGRRRVGIASLETEGKWASDLLPQGFKAAHIEPLIGLKGEVLGLIAVFRFLPGPWPDFAMRALETAAYLGSVALDRKRREEAERNGRELRALNSRILEASRMKSEFLAKMSHELRTPLNAIIGLSELLMDKKQGPLTQRQAEYLGDILQSGMHLLRLINDVLDLTKIEAGKSEIKIEEVTVEEIAREVCEVLQPLAQGRSIDLAWTSGLPPGEEARLDARKFRQVLYNLLSNAIKFSPEKTGVVRLHLDRDGKTGLAVTVKDNGPGIRVQDKAKLFEPFTQLETTSGSNHQGTGLGLAISHQLLEQHGGRLELVPDADQGACFSATFPHAFSGQIDTKKKTGDKT